MISCISGLDMVNKNMQCLYARSRISGQRNFLSKIGKVHKNKLKIMDMLQAKKAILNILIHNSLRAMGKFNAGNKE